MEKRATLTFVDNRRGRYVATTDDGTKVKFSRFPYRRGERVVVENDGEFVNVERSDEELRQRKGD